MKIGIDARPLQRDWHRGIGKSLEYFLVAFKNQVDSSVQLVFYIDAGLPKPELLNLFPESRVERVATSRLGRTRYVRSVLPSYRPIKPSRRDIDVLLQYEASFGVPTNVPTVVVFHDLIPFLFRGQERQRQAQGARKYKDALARSMYWKKYLRVWKNYPNAAKIIAISKSSKGDLLKYIKGVNAKNVEVVYHGVRQFDDSGTPTAKAKQLVKTPYLLYVGGIDIRKNIVGLLETFFALKPKYPNLRLVMVGKEFELKDQLESLGWFRLMKANNQYANDVIIPGYVTAADLGFLYKHAACFVFASRYEGFGLPALEAMSLSCPVVAYDNSSIPEVVGDAALLVKDGAELEPAIEKILNSPKLRKQLIEKGRKRAALFTWDKTAKQTLNILRQAAAK